MKGAPHITTEADLRGLPLSEHAARLPKTTVTLFPSSRRADVLRSFERIAAVHPIWLATAKAKTLAAKVAARNIARGIEPGHAEADASKLLDGLLELLPRRCNTGGVDDGAA